MLKRIAYGLIAGAVATAVMDTSQRTIIPAVSSWIASTRDSGESPDPTSSSSDDPVESSPERVAHRFAEKIGVSITRSRVAVLGNRLHWAYGTQWGIVYQLIPMRRGPQSGLLYGALLWLGSDELLLWAIGIADKPTSYPISTHLQALAAHAIYGVTLGTVSSGLESGFMTKGA